YTAMNNEWQGEWNLPLRDLSGIKLSEDVLPEYTESMAALASAIDKNQYGYTSWTFMPPNTNSYVVSGIEEVWLDSISPEQFLAELDEIFQRELAEGKAFEIPAR
ncbi:ABC transporter substrate-binding protein, partial [Paracoccaceae bacterium]|nr:ABC transporter substrate-binding protein [Paracoccaceae bacterium]